MTAKMHVEIDDALEKLTLKDTTLDKPLLLDETSKDDARVLPKRGYDNDLFRIEKHSKFTHSQIRDFEANLNAKEEEAYAQAIIKQVQQADTSTTTITKSKTKKVKKATTKSTKSTKSGAKPSPVPSRSSSLTSPSQTTSEDQEIFAKNESLRNLYDNWNLPYSENLPIVSPLPNETPLDFHATHNGDSLPTKKGSQRLSTTKLLIKNWCVLREYYRVWSGSLRTPATKAMEQGTRHHAILEEETHPRIDITDMLDFVAEKAQSLQRELKTRLVVATNVAGDQDVFVQNDATVEEIKRVSLLVDEMLTISEEDKVANNWAHNVVARLFAILANSEAREIPIHSFIDMNRSKIIEPKDGVEALENSVPISSIVDLFKFGNHKDPTDFSFFTELRNMLHFEYEKDHLGKPIIDLTSFIPETQKILSEYSTDKLSLVVSDVKTRSGNTLPYQQSVLDGAKDQTMFYRKFFEILTHDSEFTYRGMIKNAATRSCDVDKPLSPILVLQMLRLNPNLFYTDFVKLSNGEPIDFAPYDEDIKLNKLNRSLAELEIVGYPKSMDDDATVKQNPQIEFQFDLLFQNAQEFSSNTPSNESYLKELDRIDVTSTASGNITSAVLQHSFPYSHYMKPLLKTWKTPPTLRYVIARSAQLFSLFQNFVDDSTTVEYHNAISHEVFEIRHYKHSQKQLDQALRDACDFWLGRTLPKFADSLSKCNTCEFRTKCIMGRGEADDLMNKRKMVGPQLRELLGQHVS
ncbi:EXO5 [Candida theae]|uniref:Exonuclease V, mitochondrial n=1 Tax=Candida theae TaxID=1198502 RepID=A0AAD5BAP7_9ASCO|nr:EXO5 [Candida theae]KAI5948833.1 EXO5 [Candida theae]